ncbi:MAG: hypothetical protein ACREND_14635 [Gemmatimonadaceae bacterium]
MMEPDELGGAPTAWQKRIGWVSIATGFVAGLVFVVLSARDLLGL